MHGSTSSDGAAHVDHLVDRHPSVSPGEGWQTHEWTVDDACFAKMWGHDFSFRPEKSGPYVIGKIEVW